MTRQRLQHVLPRRLRAGLEPGLPEAGQVERHRAPPRVGDRREVLAPHRAVGDPGVQQHHDGSLADRVEGKDHPAVENRSATRFQSTTFHHASM